MTEYSSPVQEESCRHLFVYGTLRKGHLNPVARFLHQHAKWIGTGRMPGIKFDLGAYPAAVYKPDTVEFVEGDIFLLNELDAVFSLLDEYEGIDDPETDEYYRAIRPVKHKSENLNCWVYLYNRYVPS